MRTWNYYKTFVELLCENNIVYYRKNVTLIYADETVVSDCMYLRDKDKSKWIGIVYDGDKKEFVNFSILEDEQVISMKMKDICYVGYNTDVMNILRGYKRNE